MQVFTIYIRRVLLTFAVLALVAGATNSAIAQQGDHKSLLQSNHFGVLKAKLGEDLSIFALCTISGGTVQERSEKIANLVPTIGGALAAVAEVVTLDDGEAVCGFAHRKGDTILSLPSKSNGFKLFVKTYKDKQPIVTVEPSVFCRKSVINVFGMCYERSELHGGKKADGVTACVETIGNEPKSVLFYAGVVPDSVISKATHSPVKSGKCFTRGY